MSLDRISDDCLSMSHHEMAKGVDYSCEKLRIA